MFQRHSQSHGFNRNWGCVVVASVVWVKHQEMTECETAQATIIAVYNLM